VTPLLKQTVAQPIKCRFLTHKIDPTKHFSFTAKRISTRETWNIDFIISFVKNLISFVFGLQLFSFLAFTWLGFLPKKFWS
jgi:hypothetical protein